MVLQYYVDSDYQFNYTSDNSSDYTASVVSAYGDYVQSGKIAEKIVDTLEIDCEARYMEELISAVWSYQNEIFSIEVIYPDENVLNQMSEIVTSEIEGQADRINQTIGSHTLKLLSSDIMLKTIRNWPPGRKQSRISYVIPHTADQFKSIYDRGSACAVDQ